MKATQRITIYELLEDPGLISPLKEEYYQAVKKNWDRAAKPLDSLGRFETMTARIGAILETDRFDLKKKAILTFCADNGVVAEGISQSGQDVTTAVSRTMGKKASSVGKMAETIGCDTITIDIGINNPESIPGLYQKKVRMGTANFAQEPAMTKAEALQAIQTGIDLVLECRNSGYQILGTGEMGIGNTTTSAAVCCALLGRKASEIAGRGAGLSNEGLERKIAVIQTAIDNYHLYQAEPLTVLSHVGGLDIAGLTGVMIGGACYGVPVCLDGVITAVAALIAARMFPVVKDYLIPSHISREPAAKAVFEELGLEPVIHGDLALGEGTGCVMLFALLNTVMPLYSAPTTFHDMQIEAYTRWEDTK